MEQPGAQHGARCWEYGLLSGGWRLGNGRELPGLASSLQSEEEERYIPAGLRLSARLGGSRTRLATAGKTAGRKP